MLLHKKIKHIRCLFNVKAENKYIHISRLLGVTFLFIQTTVFLVYIFLVMTPHMQTYVNDITCWITLSKISGEFN